MIRLLQIRRALADGALDSIELSLAMGTRLVCVSSRVLADAEASPEPTETLPALTVETLLLCVCSS